MACFNSSFSCMVSASRLRRSWIVLNASCPHFPDLSRSKELLIGGNVPMAHFTASVLYLLPSTHKCGGSFKRACGICRFFPSSALLAASRHFMVWFETLLTSQWGRGRIQYNTIQSFSDFLLLSMVTVRQIYFSFATCSSCVPSCPGQVHPLCSLFLFRIMYFSNGAVSQFSNRSSIDAKKTSFTRKFSSELK